MYFAIGEGGDDVEGISNIEQGMSNLEGQKGKNGYQVNRKSGCSTVRCPVEIEGIRISGQWFEKSHHT